MYTNSLGKHTTLVGIQAINRYGIARKIMPGEEITFSELAGRCQLSEDDLQRILRQAMSKHFFKEPRRGFVAHTAATRILADNPGVADWIWMVCDEIWPAASKLLDAMEKWPGSEQPDECVC